MKISTRLKLVVVSVLGLFLFMSTLPQSVNAMDNGEEISPDSASITAETISSDTKDTNKVEIDESGESETMTPPVTETTPAPEMDDEVSTDDEI